ncbi:MAG: hypothetical protein ACJ8LV_00635, partial [Chthoniobacterales bacterium]
FDRSLIRAHWSTLPRCSPEMRAHFSTSRSAPTLMTTSGTELIGVAAECDIGHGPSTKGSSIA